MTVEEIFGELAGGVLGYHQHAFALVLFCDLLGGDLLLLNLYVILFCQPAQRLGV